MKRKYIVIFLLVFVLWVLCRPFFDTVVERAKFHQMNILVRNHELVIWYIEKQGYNKITPMQTWWRKWIYGLWDIDLTSPKTSPMRWFNEIILWNFSCTFFCKVNDLRVVNVDWTKVLLFWNKNNDSWVDSWIEHQFSQ